MRDNVDSGEFPGSTSVLLAFRVVGSKAKEHPINWGAALATRRRGDVFPAGKMYGTAPRRRGGGTAQNDGD